jgi:hypothetical protein
VKRRQVLRLISAVLGGVLVALALLAVLFALNSRSGFMGSTAATATGWTIPILAGVVAGVAAWALLLEEGSQAAKRQPALVSRCSECGRPLADEWRLCPYCGAFACESDDAFGLRGASSDGGRVVTDAGEVSS